MADISLSVSIPTFHEIAQKMEEKGIKLTDNSKITLERSTALERPVDWRLVQVRKDCVIEAAKVYKAPMNEEEIEQTDGNHFINFVEDIYNYVLTGAKPGSTVLEPSKNGWTTGKGKK